ncbi:MAG: phage tail protein [Pseudomonas sp.]|uniref:phage tail protein n=1 Tax=Pseudomonas sp. TaxID=306 RepID=UPI003D09E5B7
MTDQNSQFFAILTAVGEAKQANANALGVPWTFAQMGVGDANLTDPIPSRTQTRLINERRRAALNTVKVDPGNASIIIAEQVIPPDVGGWWIREIGLYDAAGDLVAVANCAPSFKPLLSQGTGKTQVVRLNIIVTSTANIQLKIDPAVVLATREYVDSQLLNVLPLNKVAGQFTKVRVNERGVVQEGFNPTTLAGLGIEFETQALAESGAGTEKPLNAFLVHRAAHKVVQGLWEEGKEDAWGVMKIATQNEVDTGSGGNKAVTPGTLNTMLGKRYKQSTEAALGLIRIASTPLVSAGSDDESAVTPKKLQERISSIWKAPTEEAYGVVKLATLGMVNSGADTTTVVTPATLKGHISTLWKAPTETVYGVVQLATQDEVDSGAVVAKVVTPVSLNTMLGKRYKQSTEAALGLIRIASTPLVSAGSDDESAVTPKKLQERISSIWKAPTEEAYGVVKLAAQGMVNSGADTTTVVTPATLKGHISTFWKAATETVYGYSRIATLAEANAGASDAVIITPRKMQYGISFSFGARGHLAFPTWLGGLIVNWGFETAIAQATAVGGSVGPTRDATLSLAFPTQGLGAWASMGFSTMSTTAAFAPGAKLLSNSVIRVQNNYTASAADIFWFALGN